MICKVLDEKQILKIHKKSAEILEKIGVLVPHKEMLGLFHEAGAKVDFGSQMVRIPEELVAKCLSQAGKKFTLYGRDLGKKAELGCGKRNYNSTAGEALWLESPGGERRYANFADVGTAARFADALEFINITVKTIVTAICCACGGVPSSLNKLFSLLCKTSPRITKMINTMSQAILKDFLTYKNFFSLLIQRNIWKINMTQGMATKSHLPFFHFSNLLPCQKSLFANETNRDKNRCRKTIFLQNRKGVLIIILIPVVKC